MHEMPKEIEFVTDKILKNKQLYDEVSKLLKSALSKIHNESLGHSSFCDALRTPNGIEKKLLTIYGINDRQMLHAFEKIGFHPDNRMYSSLYYQTLTLAYYIGSRADDDVMRIFALALMQVKIFNGRQYSIMPNGCQKEIAHYVISSKLRSTAVFKRYPSPFNAITNYYAPTMDTKYNPYIKRDPAHPTLGLVVLLMQSYGRIEQTFRTSIRKHYYDAVNSGERSIGMDVNSSGAKGVEVGAEITAITSAVDTIQQNLLMKPVKLNQIDKTYLKETYAISDKFLSDVYVFLDSDENESDIKNIYELIFTYLKITESNMCGKKVIETVNLITNTKGNDKTIEKIKKYLDSLINIMFKNVLKQASSSNRLKLRKVLLLILILRSKQSLCPNSKIN